MEIKKNKTIGVIFHAQPSCLDKDIERHSNCKAQLCSKFSLSFDLSQMLCVFQWGVFELLDLQGLMALTSPVCSLSLFLCVLSPLCTFSHACLTPELHVSDARWLSPPTCWVFTVILFVICCSSFLSLLSPHPNWLRQMAALLELGLRRRFLPVKTESDRLPLQCKVPRNNRCCELAL